MKTETFNAKELIKRMRTHRLLSRLSQEEVAYRANISLDHYSKIERQIGGYIASCLAAISQALGVSLSYLMFGYERKDHSEIHALIRKLDGERAWYAEEMIENYLNFIKS